MRMSATARLKSMYDNETWSDVGTGSTARPTEGDSTTNYRYVDRLKDARSKTGLNDAVKLGYGRLDGLQVIAVQDFDFMGGSLALAAGDTRGGGRVSKRR